MEDIPPELIRMFLEHLNHKQRKSIARVCSLWWFLVLSLKNPIYLKPSEFKRNLLQWYSIDDKPQRMKFDSSIYILTHINLRDCQLCDDKITILIQNLKSNLVYLNLCSNYIG